MQVIKQRLWSNDEELFELIQAELYTAVIGDIMDKLGHLHQFLPPTIHPLKETMFIAGRAMTVLEADVLPSSRSSSQKGVLSQPFGLMLEALDDLKKNEVYICSGASPQFALWGEIMSARAKQLGAVGAVVNGYSRDTHGIIRLNFPCFSMGRYAQDQAPRGKVVDWRVPVKFGEVIVEPGDIIVGDIDGVCIVPKKIETQVMTLALEKARGEKTVLNKVLVGMSAKEAFATYGIM